MTNLLKIRKIDYLRNFLEIAPISLALERAIELRMLSKIVFKKPLLDLGCGEGFFAKFLFHGKVDVGLDISEVEVEHARKSNVYKKVLVGNATSLPFKNETFNTILSNSALEHILGLEKVLRECYRALSPGGRLIITVPTPYYQNFFFNSRIFRFLGLPILANFYEKIVNKVFNHHNVFSKSIWEKKLNKAGFKIKQSFYYLPKEVVTLNDLLYPMAFSSFVTKKLWGRWSILPIVRKPIGGLLAKILYPLYIKEAKIGGYVLIVARK